MLYKECGRGRERKSEGGREGGRERCCIRSAGEGESERVRVEERERDMLCYFAYKHLCVMYIPIM